MNRRSSREVLDCAGRARQRRRFRMARDARDLIRVRKKSGFRKWNDIFDGSLCEQPHLQIGTTGMDGSLREQPQSKRLAREPQPLGDSYPLTLSFSPFQGERLPAP